MNSAVSFLLGAGFSAPFNIPTMRPFLGSFKEFASRKYPTLRSALCNHVRKLEDGSDIEGLLASLSDAENLKSALPSQGHLTCELKQWAAESRSLKAHLVSYIIERCEQFNRERAQEEIGPLLNRLNHSKKLSEIHFFTTNYDRILEYVAENTGVNLHDGFDNSGAELVAPWTREFNSKCRLYKLHGSVTYYVDRQASEDPEFLRLDRGYPLPDPDFRLSRQGRQLEPLMVLPTLEKDALDDPYGYFIHTFTETISKGGLLIAIGTSLRDKHVVSAINFNAMDVVALIVDPEPEGAIQMMPNVSSVPLRADTSECLSILREPLAELAERCVSIPCPRRRTHEVKRFAQEQDGVLRNYRTITEEQRNQMGILNGAATDLDKIEAIYRLQGSSDPGVIKALSELLFESEHSPELRKAAVGCLGLSRCADALEVLTSIATEDHLPDVRLESYLALREIGGDRANEALKNAQKRWPEDPFFAQKGSG